MTRGGLLVAGLVVVALAAGCGDDEPDGAEADYSECVSEGMDAGKDPEFVESVCRP